MWGGWSAAHPKHLVPGEETHYLLCRRLGGPQSWCGQVWKISPPLWFDPRLSQQKLGFCCNWLTVVTQSVVHHRVSLSFMYGRSQLSMSPGSVYSLQ